MRISKNTQKIISSILSTSDATSFESMSQSDHYLIASSMMEDDSNNDWMDTACETELNQLIKAALREQKPEDTMNVGEEIKEIVVSHYKDRMIEAIDDIYQTRNFIWI